MLGILKGASFLLAGIYTILLVYISSAEDVLVEYGAAVIEYEPDNNWDTGFGGYGIIQSNVDNIINYAAIAKENNADIIVAPEYGFQSINMRSYDMDQFMTLTLYIPDPNSRIVPCDYKNSNYSNIDGLIKVSCAAKELEMYIAVDLAELFPCNEETRSNTPWPVSNSGPVDFCPENGYIFHNAQVVFDRKGEVIARYRKKNLYFEDVFTPGNEDDSTAIFTSDFGVTFTLQVCFDIVFEHPGYSNIKLKNIHDVVMSTAWVDFLPFFIAPSVQNGWSRSLGVNLLVSGYHLPEKMKLGSGIFRGYLDDHPGYSYDANSGNVIVLANVKTHASDERAAILHNQSRKPVKDQIIHLDSIEKKLDEKRRIHVIMHDDLSNYTRIDLQKNTNGEEIEETICHDNNFCCTLRYQSNTTLHYKFFAFSGLNEKGNHTYEMFIEVCSVIWCKTNDIRTCGIAEFGTPEGDSFGPATFTAKYNGEQVYPLGITRELTVWDKDEYVLQQLDDEGNFKAKIPTSVPDLLSLGIVGRWYAMDPK